MIARATQPSPTGWLQTAVTFGGAAALLLLVTRYIIPSLASGLGVETVVSWFVAGGVLVFAPLTGLGCWFLVRERPDPDGRSLADRLWLRSMSRADWLWCLGSLAVIGIATLLIQTVLRATIGEVELNPSFMALEPLSSGRYWILAAWLPFWLLNILGEEFLWRGVLLPRQAVAMGNHAWLGNAAGWLLFHLAFGGLLLLTLIPIIIVLPYVVQKRRNSLIGVVIHAGLNGPGFIAVALGLV